MKIILPQRGEFGLKLYFHVPAVHAIDGAKIVCCEEGEEALYPSADKFRIVASKPDHEKRGLWGCDRQYVADLRDLLSGKYPNDELVVTSESMPRKYFVPQPFERYDIGCDVVVCPRNRSYGPNKNWPHWRGLSDALHCGHRVFAAGTQHTSARVDCPAAWDYGRPLDATIAAMLSAKLVIATDAGLAHLAVLCGRPLLMITHGDGYVAPGEASPGEPYWPVRMERYESENHTKSLIRVVRHAWDDPGQVVLVASEMLTQ